jgi:WD40 repeat protein
VVSNLSFDKWLVRINEMSDSPPPVLEYGHAEPVGRRLVRHIPRPSIPTVLLLILAAIFDCWFYGDHKAWVVERSFDGATSWLGEHVTSDGSKLLTGSGDSFRQSGGLRAPFNILDTSTGQSICTFGNDLEFASFAMFSPNEKRVLTVGGIIKQTVTRSGNQIATSEVWGEVRRTVRLWDAANGKLLATLDPVGQVQSIFGDPCPVFYSPDGKRIVALDIDGAKLYDCDGNLLGALDKSCVTDRVYFSPDSSQCVIRTTGSLPVRFRSTRDGSVMAEHVLENGTSNGFDGAFSPDGKTFACVCYGWLYLIDPTNGSLRLPPIHVHGNDSGIWYSPDGRRVLLMLDRNLANALVAVDADSGNIVATSPTAGGSGSQMTWLANTHQMALGFWSDILEIHDAATLRRMNTINTNRVWRFSTDQSRFVGKASSGTLQLFSTSNWQQTGEINLQPGGMQYITDAMFLPDPAHILTLTDKGNVQTWLRRRPEKAWGVIALPQFWLAVVFSILLICSLWRDVIRFYRLA